MSDIFKWLFGNRDASASNAPSHLDDDDPRVPGFPPALLPYHKRIEATRQPILAATALAGAPDRQDGSQLGGAPWWPEGRAWPTAGDGSPLAFLVQINFDDAPVLEGFPQTGLLQLFIGRDDLYGANLDDLKTANGFACVFHETTDQAATTDLPEATVARDDYSPLTDPDTPVALSLARATMLIHPSDHRFERLLPEIAADDDLSDAYDELVAATPAIRLGGSPTFTQQDPRDERPDLGDVTLLTIDTTEHIMWGDSGVGQFFIASEDLAKRDFSRVVYNWDCC